MTPFDPLAAAHAALTEDDMLCDGCGEDPCRANCHLGCPECGGPHPDGCVCWERDEQVSR